jgi:hypothetical protein
MYPCVKYEKIASTDGSALDGRESARAETEILNTSPAFFAGNGATHAV